MSNPLHWAAEHPVPVAIGVFAIGAVLLLVMSAGGGGGSSSSGASDMSAFYAASAAQGQASAGLAATQSNNATALGVAQIQAGAATSINASNNATALGVNQSNNDLSAYETYKQVRLATQQSQFAYQLNYDKNTPNDYIAALANINHGLSFGSAA